MQIAKKHAQNILLSMSTFKKEKSWSGGVKDIARIKEPQNMTLTREKWWILVNSSLHIPACNYPIQIWFCERNNWLKGCHTVSTTYSFTYIYRDARRSNSRICSGALHDDGRSLWALFLCMAPDGGCVLKLRKGTRLRGDLRSSRSCRKTFKTFTHPSKNPHMLVRHRRLAHLAFKNQSAELLVDLSATQVTS